MLKRYLNNYFARECKSFLTNLIHEMSKFSNYLLGYGMYSMTRCLNMYQTESIVCFREKKEEETKFKIHHKT